MNSQRLFSVAHISCFANTAENGDMDAKEIRAENLRKLVAEFGSIAKLSEAVDTAASYISQIFSDKHPATVGDKLARKIEAALNKPHGWMDREHPVIHEDTPPHGIRQHITKEDPADYAPEVTLADAIKALEIAFQRGSLKPQALKNLIGLLDSINPAPPAQDTMLPPGDATADTVAAAARWNKSKPTSQ